MQEWMIAMLALSIMLIVRDMAKTILSGKGRRMEEAFPLYESHPQKEKVEKYAESFQKLADTFYGMPYRKDYLSSGQVEQILKDTGENVCTRCYQQELCWRENQQQMCTWAGELIRAVEEGDPQKLQSAKTQWMSVCGRFTQYYDRLLENFQREKQRLIWDNQMIEGRLAVAQQLAEISRLMEMVARDLYDISQPDPDFLESLTRSLKKRHIVLKTAWVMDKAEGRRQIFLTMRARSGQCISVSEVSQILSGEYGTPMTAAGDGRRVLNGEFHTVRFTEDVSYQMLYGVARLTKEQDKVSGDNYACRQDGEYSSCSEGAGRYVFYSGYVCGGSLYRDL